MEKLSDKNLLWIVAAGTGGHIFPGLNVVEEWQKTFPKSEFLFFGDKNRLESKIIPERGYPIYFLSVGRWKGGGLLSRLIAVGYIFIGVIQALLKTFSKKPILLLSAGGYVSVPVAIACVVRRIPFFILEPNIKAGMANRILSRFAKAVFCTPAGDATHVMKCVTYEFGNPVRKDLKQISIRPEVKKVLVLGGSQGALNLCWWAVDMAKSHEISERKIEFILQAGASNFEVAQQLASDAGVEGRIKIVRFIEDIPSALAEADLVIARAGAMTIAELAVAGMPTVFVPYPRAADNHQVVNAQLLVQNDAALIVEEGKSDSFNELKAKLLELSDGGKGFRIRQSLSNEFQKWARPKSQEDIVRIMAEFAGVRHEARNNL